MKTLTRTLALVLAALMMLLTACSEKAAEETAADTPAETSAPVAETPQGGSDTPSQSGTGDLIVVEEDYVWSDGVKKNDYGGCKFVILNGCTASWFSYTRVTTEETTGEPVNDAIFERTQRANEYLNVVVEENNVSDSPAQLRQGVKAGTNDFDIALCTLMNSYGIAMENNVFDLNTLSDDLDFKNVWWDRNAVHDLDIGGKLYFVTSDFDTTRFDSIRSLYFNKQIRTDLGLENPYDLVDENHWTIDKFTSMCEAAQLDMDGDGVMTDMDRYGIVSYGELISDMLLAGSGIHYIEKDPETGRLIDGTQGERMVDVYGKILHILWDENLAFDCHQSRYDSYKRGLSDRIQEAIFTENKALFYSECMAWTRVLREMEADFGVMPPPKFNEDQDRYYSIMINPFMQMIPITNQDISRTCNILDALAAASHDTVVDAYVNVTLSGKVARDPDTVRMLHLVFDELSYSIHFSNVAIRSTIQTGLTGNVENVTSLVRKMSKSVTKTLDKTNVFFFGGE